MRFSGNQQHAGLSEIFSISNSKPGPRGQTSCRGRPYDRPCRARPRNAFTNPGFHGKSRAAKTPLSSFPPSETPFAYDSERVRSLSKASGLEGFWTLVPHVKAEWLARNRHPTGT